MRVTIHRGAREIGGTCVTVRSGSTRILLDIGMPLTGLDGLPFDQKTIEGKSSDELVKAGILPDVAGLYAGQERSYDAVFISHSHKDHYGLIKHLNPDIPVYMSAGAEGMVHGLDKFLSPRHRVELGKVCQLVRGRKVKAGDMAVVPYSVDHSGFDSMAFYIKGDGRSLLYTGDFRATGWTKDSIDRMLHDISRPLDCMMMEGTTLSRKTAEYPDEPAVVSGVIRLLNDSPADAVIPVYCSGQNIDRIVSFYKAVRKVRATLVVDPYTACMMKEAEKISKEIPQINWMQVRVFVANYGHGDMYVNKISDKDMIRLIGINKIKYMDFGAEQGRCLLLMRDVMIPVVEKIPQIKGNKLIYSLWPGYIADKKKSHKFYSFLKRNKLEKEYIHTSGHADIDTLKRVVKDLNPTRLVPVHTAEPDKFKEHFGACVSLKKDGEEFEV